jgi:hypothetical protein
MNALEELDDALWDLHDALMVLAAAVDPEGAREKALFEAEEFMAANLIWLTFGVGPIADMPMEVRPEFAEHIEKYVRWQRAYERCEGISRPSPAIP